MALLPDCPRGPAWACSPPVCWASTCFTCLQDGASTACSVSWKLSTLYEIPYIWLCWMPAAFHSGIHTRPPCACGKQGHGTWKVTAGGSTGKRKDRFQASSQPKSWNCRKLHWKDEKKIKKRKGDLNGSKPAEWYKGEKQCWHETVPAAFHRPGTANLSQEVKQRKGVKWVKAKRTRVLSTPGKARALSSPLHGGLWPAPILGALGEVQQGCGCG